MPRMLRLAVVAVLACAPATAPQVLPGPSDIPGLRETLLRDSADIGARIGLAIALRESDRIDEALEQLEAVAAERPADPGPRLLLGLTHEEAGNWSEARDAYERYTAVAASGPLRESIAKRLRYIRRRELQAEIRRSIRMESELGPGDADARTVAVYPFVFQGSDSTLRPLSRAVAELLATDLAYTERLRVLERARVQLLLDEIRLSGSELVDPGTALRGGRLLGAGRVVQGTVTGNEDRVQLDAVVVVVREAGADSNEPLTEQDRIDGLFDVEKRLALSLYGAMGVALTVAERERVLQRPTENLQALLAFGQGLEAEDRGDWAEAIRQYRRALTMDPDFDLAERREGDAVVIADAEESSIQVLIESGVDEEDVPVTPRSEPATGGVSPGSPAGAGLPQSPILAPDPIGGIVPDPLLRDPGAEVLGQEGIGTRTLLRIIFHRPSG